jgi:hypothetical protein
VDPDQAFTEFGEHIALLWGDLRITNTAQDRFLARFALAETQLYFLSWAANTYQNIPALAQAVEESDRPQYTIDSLQARIEFPNNDLAELLHYNPSPTPSDTEEHQALREYFESIVQEVHNLINDEHHNTDRRTDESQD